MSIDEIAAEALRLPPRERARLAESLWESLDDPRLADAEMDDEAAADLALHRDAEMESGKVQPISHAEMMARLRK